MTGRGGGELNALKSLRNLVENYSKRQKMGALAFAVFRVKARCISHFQISQVMAILVAAIVLVCGALYPTGCPHYSFIYIYHEREL